MIRPDDTRYTRALIQFVLSNKLVDVAQLGCVQLMSITKYRNSEDKPTNDLTSK